MGVELGGEREDMGHKPISPKSETFAYVLNKIEALRSFFLFISFVKHHQGVEVKL